MNGGRGPRIVAVEGIDGAGKSTLMRNLADALTARGDRVHIERLSAQMASVFKEVVDRAGSGANRYQDMLPGPFRRAAYIVDAAVQFRYRADFYSTLDWLLFDRWLQTYDVYCDGQGRHEELYQGIAGTIPEPFALLHVKVSPETALRRIRSRGDWTVDNWSPDRLLADLQRLDALYDKRLADEPRVLRLDGEGTADDLLSSALEALDATEAVG